MKPPKTAPPPQSAPCPIATHHCSRSRCVTRCPHPAQHWLWAEPRVAAVWGGGGIGHRGAGLGYGMEGDASAHCAPRCDGGCGGDAVCGAQSCSGTAQRAKGGGGGGGHQSRGDFLPLFGLIPTGAAVRGPPKHRGCSHPTERSAEQLQQCSAGGAALLPAQSRKWVPVQQKGQQSPQPSPPPPPSRVQSPIPFSAAPQPEHSTLHQREQHIATAVHAGGGTQSVARWCRAAKPAMDALQPHISAAAHPTCVQCMQGCSCDPAAQGGSGESREQP